MPSANATTAAGASLTNGSGAHVAALATFRAAPRPGPAAVAQRLAENVERAVRGKRHEVRLVVAALACRGHVLIEDVPGTAKTILGRALGQSIRGARFGRVRSTPDLEPADVTGVVAFDQREGGFVFRPGPIFANTLLIAGLNRAMPRTQWAVLEAIADGQVTVDGRARKLPQPFLVLATEDPTGEAPRLRGPQLDRFLMRISLGYPHPDDELEIVRGQRRDR